MVYYVGRWSLGPLGSVDLPLGGVEASPKIFMTVFAHRRSELGMSPGQGSRAR
jgi:hypothetical protein